MIYVPRSVADSAAHCRQTLRSKQSYEQRGLSGNFNENRRETNPRLCIFTTPTKGETMHADDTDDVTLAAAAANGDNEAFRTLFNRHNAAVVHQSLRQLGDMGDAEDVAQSTWVLVFRHLSRFDPGRASFTSWLHSIRHRRCKMCLRKRRRFPLMMDDTTIESIQALAKPTTSPRVDGLEFMPPHLAEAVRLVHLEDRSFSDAARIIGVAIGTVHRRATLGIRLLRKHMGVGHVDKVRRTHKRPLKRLTARDIQIMVA